MTALRFFSTAKPSLVGAPVLPMSKQDEQFWQLLKERQQQKEQSNERSN